MPGCDYSSTWPAPAPLWAEIRAKRTPGTHSGAPWALGSGKVAPQCLKQPLQCGRVSASQPGSWLPENWDQFGRGSPAKPSSSDTLCLSC